MFNRRLATSFLFILILLAQASCTPQAVAAVDEATPTPIPTVAVAVKPTYVVQRGEVVSKLQFTGRIAPISEESLSFATDGRIRKVYAKEGAFVKKGDLLADLTQMDDLERQQAADKLELRRSEIKLEMARLQLDLTRNQYASWKMEYPYVVGTKEYEVELAQINLDEVKLHIEEREVAMAAASLLAPLDGQITSSRLADGLKVTALEAMAVVSDVSQLEAAGKPASDQLTTLVEGMSVTATLTDRPGVEIPAKIRKLPYSTVSTLDVKPTDQNVRVSLTPPAGIAFKLGDLVRLTVTIERRDSALWLPPQAIRTFDARRFVVIKEGEAQKRLDIKVGIQSEDRVEITEGLQEGQLVVAP